MEHRPDDVDAALLTRALERWGIHAADLAYVPVGFGEHHWRATGADGGHWFLTVADLEAEPHCGTGAQAAWHGIEEVVAHLAE